MASLTVRCIPEWRSEYFHLTMRGGRKIAKVAIGRRLAFQTHGMMRTGTDYEQWKTFGSFAGQPGTGHGMKQNIEQWSGYPAPLHGGV